MTTLIDDINWDKGGGLVPAVVQHAVTARVLMLGYMNSEALEQTRSGGWVCFYSRSRQRLWVKGETSGNKLALRDIEVDCDGDTLLVQAIPSGPTCHLLKNSCFDSESERPGFGFVGQLEHIISARAARPQEESYTARLINEGTQRMAQKIGEEGVEVALAAVSGDEEQIVSEAADLVYHLLVLLQQQKLSFADVAQQLESRHRR